MKSKKKEVVMRDRKRYSEAFKLKVMEELRDAKWKSLQEAARAYGIAEMSVYNWMHRLDFEHLKGRRVFVKTRTETDRIKELEAEVRKLRMALADEVLDHKIDQAALRLMCSRAGTIPDEVKKALPWFAEKVHRDFVVSISRSA